MGRIKERFLVCFTPDEMVKIRKESKTKGLAMSDLIRRAVDSYFSESKATTPK
jgi:hypothetical protein